MNIVLVRSIYSRNVGQVSRVMGNMGADRLILIEPQCEIDFAARQGAAGSQKCLMEVTTYANWQDFFVNESDGIRIAFSAKKKMDTDPVGLEKRLRLLAQEKIDFVKRPLYLIFGQEDHGLSNQDVEYANYICQLPIYGSFTSLNLSHAVLLAAYISQTVLINNPIAHTESTEVTPDTFYFPAENIQLWLERLGFTIGDRRVDVYKVLKRLFLSSASTAKDFRILEAVINQTIRKISK